MGSFNHRACYYDKAEMTNKVWVSGLVWLPSRVLELGCRELTALSCGLIWISATGDNSEMRRL